MIIKCTCGIGITPCNSVVVKEGDDVIGEYFGRIGCELKNPERYTAICIGKYLQELNKKLKEERNEIKELIATKK